MPPKKEVRKFNKIDGTPVEFMAKTRRRKGKAAMNKLPDALHQRAKDAGNLPRNKRGQFI